MRKRKMVDDVFCVGAVDWNHRLFDSLIPLPDGTSYRGGARPGKEVGN